MRFVESSDRVAWSESQMHEATGVVHRMIEGSVGLAVGSWEKLFDGLEVGASSSHTLTFGTKRQASDMTHEWLPVCKAVTFQGLLNLPGRFATSCSWILRRKPTRAETATSSQTGSEAIDSFFHRVRNLKPASCYS